jgi:hypothetical protein
VTCTSAGIDTPRSAATRAAIACVMSAALVPDFFVIAMVTAGAMPVAGPALPGGVPNQT